MPETVLVTGATGKVGRNVVAGLVREDVPVRALVRDPDRAGLPDRVDVVRGDLARPDTVSAAMDGVGAVFLLWPFLTAEAAPFIVDIIGKHAGRIVYLSSLGVRDDVARQGDPINQFHADIEHLIVQTGLAWTFLRASGFAGNTLRWAPQIRATGVVREPFGGLARPLIHERDIGAVAVQALTRDGHTGAKHVLTGPGAVTAVAQVAAIGAAIGRSLRFDEITPDAARAAMIADGWPADVASAMLEAYAQMLVEPEPVTRTVEEITGRRAATFGEWARDHAADFR